jgi:tetratricopeptide (TPR) repeat protein
VLRLAGFFLVVLVVLLVLQQVPFVGAVFRVPILGFWGTAILVSAVASKTADLAVARRQVRGWRRQLGAVETAHNQGKLGALLVARRRWREALPCLERAVAGEPEVVEWRYRLGCAQLRTGRTKEALATLSRAAEAEEEHAYGAVLMRLAEAALKAGDPQGSIVALDRRDRNHGPNAESAWRRGVALRALGKRGDARASFRRSVELARTSAGYQEKQDRWWALRAWPMQFV